MLENTQKRLKLGVVANEFFDAGIGRFGGFGWAARQVARFFKERPELNVDVVFLAGATNPDGLEEPARVHDTLFIPRMANQWLYWKTVYAEKIDLLLLIDYRPHYSTVLKGLPRTPAIVWVRDPRTTEDASRLLTVRMPDKPEVVPQTVQSYGGLSMRRVLKMSRLFFKRPILFATPAPYLVHKVEGTYGVAPNEVSILPNIIDIKPNRIQKSERPSVVFLGRLDPYKRPWVFLELAKDFPEVDFILCGRAHTQGHDGWQPGALPENVLLKGHVDGEEKVKLLAEAWALINTSLHEGLAVSFQEALRCETPLLSSVDPQGIVSAFGIYAGYWEGTGLEALPRFRSGLRRLLEDHCLRERLGREGREWVQNTHTPELFLSAFQRLCRIAGVREYGRKREGATAPSAAIPAAMSMMKSPDDCIAGSSPKSEGPIGKA